jgi:hypothetical protein
LAVAEGGQEAGVGVGSDPAKSPPVVGVEGLVHGEIVGVVHSGFHSEGSAFFQVGLGLGGAVVDLQLGGDVSGDDFGGEAPRGLELGPIEDSAVDDQGDLVGSAQVQVAADGGLEPGPGPAGLVEHGGVGDFQLSDREGPLEAGSAVVEGEWVGHDAHQAS